MAMVTIATVEVPNADVICEALTDAGISAKRIAVRPANQWIQHKLRPFVDIQVEAEEVPAARAVLSHLEEEAETAAVSQSRETGSRKSDDDLRLEKDHARRAGRPLSPSVALGTALVLPVAGPLYARATRLAILSLLGHGVGLFMWLLATSARGWYRSDLHADLGAMVFVVFRFIDVVGSLHAVAQHNARLVEAGDRERAEGGAEVETSDESNDETDDTPHDPHGAN